MVRFTANEAISAQVLAVQRVRCKQVFEGLLPLYDAFEQFVANAEVREVDDCQARIVSESLKISHELWIAQELGLKETEVRTGVQFTVWVATQSAE